jgi:hypothetical protein
VYSALVVAGLVKVQRPSPSLSRDKSFPSGRKKKRGEVFADLNVPVNALEDAHSDLIVGSIRDGPQLCQFPALVLR